MRWFHQPFYLALLCVAAPFLLLSRGAHYMPTLKTRFFGPPRASPGRKSLWLHAVSVGETGVAAVLARHLPAEGRLTFTTVTPTGQHAARRVLGGRIDLTYLPFDLFWAVYRFLTWARPSGAVLVEGDYWPFLLSTLRRRGVPVYVVNGRISDRTFRRLRLLPRWIVRSWFRPITAFGLQTARDRERLAALGVDDRRLTVTGNLKFDVRPAEPHPPLTRRLGRLAGNRPLLVAGSTMEGEEQHVLRAFEALSGRAMLLLAPRHPERAEAVRKVAREMGFRVVMRSEFDAADQDPNEELASSPDPSAASAPGRAQDPPLRSATDPVSLRDPGQVQGPPSASGRSGKPDIVILDTIGELAGLYALAASAFIGGTLVRTGGHNPLEPASHGVPILAGPSMHNFRSMAAQFDRVRAWRLVDDATELADAWRDWLDHPEDAAAYGERARQLLVANRGAVESTLQFLRPLIDRWQNQKSNGRSQSDGRT